MYCAAVDGFYLKANGEIPCWCSPGEHHPILQLPSCEHELAGIDLATDVLNGEELVRMRRELHANRLPFDYCQGCCFLLPGSEESWKRVDSESFALRRVGVLQVESSFFCNVDCPLCVRLAVRKETKDPPYQLARGLYEKAIDDLLRHGIGVEEVWFSGRGEPFMNPELPAMVRYGKDKLGARMSVHTNANFKFKEEHLTCGWDEVAFSIDGVRQEAYERYRRGGRLDRAVEFARQFAAARRRLGLETPELLWKMVLFDWNSSDEDLRRAAAWAEEIGMDKLVFVNTDTPGGISYRDGTRIEEVRVLAEELDKEHGIAVEVEGWGSVYDALPEVELQMRIDDDVQDGRPRKVLLARLYNHLLEDSLVRVDVDLVDERGEEPRRLATADLDLPERSEYVDSMELPLEGLPPGEYRVNGVVSRRDNGLALSSFACDLVLPG